MCFAGWIWIRRQFELIFQDLALLDVREDAEKLQLLRNQFKEANIIFLVTDITKRAVVESAFKTILEQFKQIDIVVNGAGLVQDRDIELVIATNLVSALNIEENIAIEIRIVLFHEQFGLINVSLVAMDVMSKSNGGNGGIMVNIASVAGLSASPGTPVYNATKHGGIGFTRSMAVSHLLMPDLIRC